MARTGDTQMIICVNCGSDLTTTIRLDSEDIVVCHDCGYGRPSLRDPIQYDDDYEKKYLAYDEKSICGIRLLFVSRAKQFLDRSFYQILDYGCGSGAFVKAARDDGYEAYGYDVNDYTEDLRPPEGFEPGIVTAWDSFEHLTDEQQVEFFKSAKSANIIIVSVPNFQAPQKDESLKEWRHYRPREHLHYYTVKSLCFRFEREGYKFAFTAYDEDNIRKAPWNNNILTVGFTKG